MKKWVLAVLALVLFSAGAVMADTRAKGNNLGIDDTCYTLYKETERHLGKDSFKAASDLLLQAATEKKDDKALVLYYVEVLKDLVARPVQEDNDAEVDAARENLMRIAREKNQLTYFYLSYQISQEYYTRHGKAYRALLLLQEMQANAISDCEGHCRPSAAALSRMRPSRRLYRPEQGRRRIPGFPDFRRHRLLHPRGPSPVQRARQLRGHGRFHNHGQGCR